MAACLRGATAVLADDANYQNFIIGERAQGMGGASGALATSLDACYFNPAGLGRVKDNRLSVSANLYGFQKYRAENGLTLGEDMKRNSFVGIPGAVAGVSKLEGEGARAFSAFIPDRRSFNEIAAFVDKRNFYTFSEEDQTLWVGPSFGYPCTDQLLLGAPAFVVYRTFSHMQNVAWGDVDYSYSNDLKYDSHGLVAILGAQYKVDQDWNLGLVLQAPSWRLAGRDTYAATMVSPSSGSAGLYGDDLTTGNYSPPKVTASVGWEKPKDRAVGLDLTYHFAGNYNVLSGDLTGSGVPDTSNLLHLKREAVLDLNLGGEYYVRGKYSVRLGFYTSHSTAPDVDASRPSSEYQMTKTTSTASRPAWGARPRTWSTMWGCSISSGRGAIVGRSLTAPGMWCPTGWMPKSSNSTCS